MEEVRKRGHWKTYTSLRRYEKSGRLQKVLNATPGPLLKWCQEIAPRMAEFLEREPSELPALPRDVR